MGSDPQLQTMSKQDTPVTRTLTIRLSTFALQELSETASRAARLS